MIALFQLPNCKEEEDKLKKELAVASFKEKQDKLKEELAVAKNEVITWTNNLEWKESENHGFLDDFNTLHFTVTHDNI